MRRLVLLASAIVFVDTVFYAAITPLLPSYADDFGLTKSAAGMLSAAYLGLSSVCLLSFAALWHTRHDKGQSGKGMNHVDHTRATA